MVVTERPLLTKPHSRWVRRDTDRLIASLGRYTRFVLFSKISLAAMSLLMIVAIIILPVLNSDKEGLRIAFSTVQDKQERFPVMSKPSFQGVDEKNQPYLVTADSAIQQDEKTIILTNIQADIMTQEQTWLSLKAVSGVINTQAKQMTLKSNVELVHQDGYEFKTQSIDVDMNQHIAKGNQPIEGKGPMGSIRANGFEWRHNDRVMKFIGGVKMVVRANG